MANGFRCVNGSRRAFTVVEIIVSVLIVSALLALLLPAILSARESARVIQCRSNLKELSLSIHDYESALGTIPGNGWGFEWVGEPDRGTGPAQPGGWIYQMLPFIGQPVPRALGSGLAGMEQRAALGQLTSLNVPLLRCPTRAGAERALRNPLVVWRNADTHQYDSRTDYAINEGDFVTDTDSGPLSLAAGDTLSYPWKDMSKATGVSFLRSTVRLRDITDGSSNTYLLGEKHVASAHYDDGCDPGYDQNPFTGVDLDLSRWSNFAPHRDGADMSGRAFGSAHASGFHMSFCDGSIRSISYHICIETHQQLGNRQDSRPVSVP